MEPEPKIISASRRTDIPAFYTPWLIGRLRAGYCHTLNPFGGQVYRVSLAAPDVIALAFWTRNAAPLLPYLDELDGRGYRYYFNYSLTGYPRAIETHNPDLQAAIKTFRRLSERTSPAQARWRYDPIILSSATPAEYHLRQFERIAIALNGYTQHAVISFVQFYGKTDRNLGRIAGQSGVTFENPGLEQQRLLLARLVEIAAGCGMTVYSCCNDTLVGAGVQKNRCIDPAIVAALAPGLESLPQPRPTRPDCGCIASVDIGAYDTCLFGCAYCYATNSRAAAMARYRAHDPDDTILRRSPALIGKDLDAPVNPSRAPAGKE